MNEADALRAAALLESAGLRPASNAPEADVLLLNTCVVRQQAEDKIISRLSFMADLKRSRPERAVVLMGCLVGRNPLERPALRERFPFIDLFLPPSDIAPLRNFLQVRGLFPAPEAGGDDRQTPLIPSPHPP